MLPPVLDAPTSLRPRGRPDGMQPHAPPDYDRGWHGLQRAARAAGTSLNVPARAAQRSSRQESPNSCQR